MIVSIWQVCTSSIPHYIPTKWPVRRSSTPHRVLYRPNGTSEFSSIYIQLAAKRIVAAKQSLCNCNSTYIFNNQYEVLFGNMAILLNICKVAVAKCLLRSDNAPLVEKQRRSREATVMPLVYT